jgi:hypothetical protein
MNTYTAELLRAAWADLVDLRQHRTAELLAALLDGELPAVAAEEIVHDARVVVLGLEEYLASRNTDTRSARDLTVAQRCVAALHGALAVIHGESLAGDSQRMVAELVEGVN